MNSTLTAADFTRLFTDAQKTAFRLEARDHYAEAGEVEPFARFLNGQRADLTWKEPWRRRVAEYVSRGVAVSRLKVLSWPLTEYNRFLIHAARAGIEAGEDLRYIFRTESEPVGLPVHDYWMFDRRVLGIFRHDDEDRLVARELVTDPQVVEEHLIAQELAWASATPWAELSREHL